MAAQDENEEDAPLIKLAVVASTLPPLAITCVACRGELIAVGSASGAILIFRSSSTLSKSPPQAVLSSGSKSTVDVGFDSAGTGLVASNEDGSVSVFVMNAMTSRWEVRHSSPMLFNASPYFVAIDPECSSKRDVPFAFYHGQQSQQQLAIARRNWWGSSRADAPLRVKTEGGGGCGRVVWRGDLLAWTAGFNSELLVHDAREDKPVFSLSLDRNMGLSHSLVWESDDTLLVSFASSVRVVRVVVNNNTGSSSKWNAYLVGKLEAPCPLAFACPLTATGVTGGGRRGRNGGRLVLFGQDRLARVVERQGDGRVLGSVRYEQEGGGGTALLAAYDAQSGRIVCAENHHATTSSGGASVYAVQARTVEDSFHFAVSHANFARAMDVAIESSASAGGSLPSPAHVLDLHVMHLIAQHQFEAISPAVRAFRERLPPPPLPLLPNDDDDGWPRWSALLAQKRALHCVLDLFPSSSSSSDNSDNNNNPVLLDCALDELLELGRFVDAVKFVRTHLREFQHVDAVIDQLSQYGVQNPELAPALALCRSVQQQQASSSTDGASTTTAASLEASFHAMMLQRGMEEDAIEVLARAPHLWRDAVLSNSNGSGGGGGDALRQLFANASTEPKAQSLLLSVLLASSSSSASASSSLHRHSSGDEPAVGSVAVRLVSDGLPLQALRLVRRANRQTGRSSRDLCDLEVRLCCEHDVPRLMELLRDTGNYTPDAALHLCRQHGLMRETVYLLERLGGRQHALDALRLLLDQDDGVRLALELAERENLVAELVSLAQGHGVHVLLQLVARSSSSQQLSPAQLVRDLPGDLPMIQLAPVLVELFQGLRANTLARSTGNRLFLADASLASRSLSRQFRRAVKINAHEQSCALCGLPLEGGGEGAGSLVVFRSKHVYHKRCLDDAYRELGGGEEEDEGQTAAINAASLVKHHCLVFGRAAPPPPQPPPH